MARAIILLGLLVQGIVLMSSPLSKAAVLTVALLVLSLASVGGCRRGQLTAAAEEPTAEEMVGYYSPRSIKLLPFTKPRSFDNDLIPAALQSQFSALRSVLESGVPTVRNKMAGHGQGSIPASVPDYMARFAMHLTASNIVLLVDAAGLSAP